MYYGDGRKVDALLNNLLTYCDSNDARQCSHDHMATFLEGFKGIFGFDLLGRAPRAPGADEESDDADEGLTALGSSRRSVTVSTAGVCCKKLYICITVLLPYLKCLMQVKVPPMSSIYLKETILILQAILAIILLL